MRLVCVRFVTVMFQSRDGNKGSSRAASCLISSLKRTMAKSYGAIYKQYVEMNKEMELAEILGNLLDIISSSFLFPSNWLAMVMAQMRIAKETLRRLSVSLNVSRRISLKIIFHSSFDCTLLRQASQRCGFDRNCSCPLFVIRYTSW